MPHQSWTIGNLAKAVDVPVSTIRYYERRGLLSADQRSPGNYRLYNVESLERLRFIRAAQHAGFTLGDIESLLNCRDEGGIHCRELQALIDHRLEAIECQLHQLEHDRRLLRSWLEVCRVLEHTGRCDIIASLAAGPESPDAARMQSCTDSEPDP